MTDAAKKQFNYTDYMLLGSRWRPVKWPTTRPSGVQMFGHSGLNQVDFNEWLHKMVKLDGEAH